MQEENEGPFLREVLIVLPRNEEQVVQVIDLRIMEKHLLARLAYGGPSSSADAVPAIAARKTMKQPAAPLYQLGDETAVLCR
jgi:hypothetical protein